MGLCKKQCFKKVEKIQKKCIRNVYLAGHKSHTEPIFNGLSILNFKDNITLNISMFMNDYRNKKLRESFNSKITNITCTDELQTRHNDYNFQNFPINCLIKTWNSLSIDVKSPADKSNFQETLKWELLSKYSSNFKYEDFYCYSCN